MGQLISFYQIVNSSHKQGVYNTIGNNGRLAENLVRAPPPHLVLHTLVRGSRLMASRTFFPTLAGGCAQTNAGGEFKHGPALPAPVASANRRVWPRSDLVPLCSLLSSLPC